ncbi:hypothetical protein [Bradyrhizobium sp. DASA03007]|uniref:hypothetical protein n=1 Tax=unclassified Bradyrhizobium TaxID=2631580 RepID=UPI003F6EB201
MRNILRTLADFAGDEDTCFPRQSIIALITGYSRPTVNINLGKLQDIGLIEMTGRKHANGGTRSSEYHLLIDENPAVDQTLFYKDPDNCPPFVPRKDRPEGVRQNDTPGVRQDDRGVSQDDSGCNAGEQRGVGQDDTLNHNLEPHHEPKARTAKPRKHVWPEDYRDQFWKAYPKRRGNSRKEAIAALDRIHAEDEVAFEDILAGTKWYADRMNADVKKDRENEQFIQHAFRWLKKAKWESESPPDKPRSTKRVAI